MKAPDPSGPGIIDDHVGGIFVNEINEPKLSTRRAAFRRAMIVLVAGALGLVGCLERELRPLNPCTLSGVARTVNVDNVEKVDLLFMIDNSGSMEEEQASLASEIPRLVRVLTSGENGDETFTPVKSLRVGIISSDLGTGPSGACGGTGFGDDGVLITTGNPADPGCSATYPTWLEFNDGEDDPDAIAADVNCVAGSLGTNGCGFEQQLEAILKALTPSTSTDIVFAGGTSGHGDGQNNGFVRDDSLLAIIAVTDEDDCSATDQSLFVQENPALTPNINLRCYVHRDLNYPVSRYTDGLLRLRADNPDLLVYATIAGLPVDLVPESDVSGAAFVSAVNDILDAPEMQEQPDPDNSTQLLPSCDIGERGVAYPARRMIELARDLEDRGANGIVQSICQADFSGALDAIIAKIADSLGGACLPRPLTRNAEREVECDVVEIVSPELGSCDAIPGRVDDGTIDHDDDPSTPERTRCIVNQIVVSRDNTLSEGDGWYYDDFSADVLETCDSSPQRISFTDGASPRNGSVVRLECLQSVQGTAGEVGVGTDCSSDSAICGSPSASVRELFSRVDAEGTMTCDEANTNTCQAQCENDSECPGGYVCYPDANPVDGLGFCINPTCN
ncbi:MAG: hypothetical protein CMN30_27530 [Sandaracinus sp.]|nr:hypothetical protein [Sandaracinus sp.]